MIRLLLLVSILSSTYAWAQQNSLGVPLPEQPNWSPTQYQKVTLPKRISEGVILFENKSGDNYAYSGVYFVQNTIVKYRVLPKEVYFQLKKDLALDVNDKTRMKRVNDLCPNQIIVSSGNFTEEKGALVPKEISNQRICLIPPDDFGKTEQHFKTWYLNARAIFGL